MFVLTPSDASKLAGAILALSQNRDISILEHNSLCVLLGSISDLAVDPQASYGPQGIVLPVIHYAGGEYKAVGLRAEPISWWSPDPMSGIDSMRRMVFRASQQLLRVLSAVRPKTVTAPSGAAISLGSTGTIATYARVADAVVPMAHAQSDVASYPADMPKPAVAAAFGFLSYSAEYIGETVINNTTPIVQPTPELRMGELYAQALAEAYRKDMVRNYWIDLGAFGLAIVAGVVAAYQVPVTSPEKLETPEKLIVESSPLVDPVQAVDELIEAAE